MFSGIVEESAKVTKVNTATVPYKIVIESSLDHTETKIGDSIAIDGVCLTVVEKKGKELSFDIALETIRRSTIGDLKSGDVVHTERSLKVGDRISGHFVFGHVDVKSTLLSRKQDGNYDRLLFSLPEEVRGMVAEKGSISISGVSLTVGEVTAEDFAVYLIPHTSEVTKLSKLPVGGTVNIEIDQLARYVQSLLFKGEPKKSVISKEFLENAGYKVS